MPSTSTCSVSSSRIGKSESDARLPPLGVFLQTLTLRRGMMSIRHEAKLLPIPPLPYLADRLQMLRISAREAVVAVRLRHIKQILRLLWL